ncbi:MAG: hypothetical protein ACOX6T_14910 [Myxococcales bacterium]|jgi:outer membrane lipoprotein-sorting protein
MKRLVILIALLLVPAAAHAYLLSAAAVIHKMGVHRRNLKLATMVVKGEITFEGPEVAAAAVALGRQVEESKLTAPMTISYKMPGRCRVELEAAEGREGPSASNINGKVTTTGTALGALTDFAAYVCPLLDGRGGFDGVLDLAKTSGIKTTKVALGRAEGVVAYVIGAHPRDVGVPSLWVEKDRFEPLRLVLKDGESFRELRLIDYSSAVAGEWHPRVVELRKATELSARFVLDKIEPNAKLADAIF